MAMVRINLSPERVRDLQHGLSDIACWARGYVCALPPDDRAIYAPIGIEEVRDLNIILKGALSDHDEGLDPIDDALVALTRTASAACDATRGREDRLPYQIAAHLHDEIVNLRRKLKGEGPNPDSAPWPFGDQP